MSKRFSEQFKQEAVQLVSTERPIKEVASQLGIHARLERSSAGILHFGGPTMENAQELGSTQSINQRDWLASSHELRRWIYGGGRVLSGLVRRRQEEVFLLVG